MARAVRPRIAMRPVVVAMLATLVWFGCNREQRELTAPGSPEPSFSLQGVQQGALGAALAVHRRHSDRLIGLPGVVGTAVGLTTDGRPAVKIYTKAAGVGGLPETLEGIPVVVEVTGEFFAQPAQGKEHQKGKLRKSSLAYNTSVLPLPVPIGVSTSANGFLAGFCFAGTIGARVKAGTNFYALSNNHVYALENTFTSGDVLQPGLADTGCDPTGSNVLGTLSSFVTILLCSSTSCPDNTVDAAIAAVPTDASGTPTTLGNSTPVIQGGYGIPNSTTTGAVLGQSVQKYGRTTSLTTGTVKGIDATVSVGYLTGTAKFVHQIVVGPGKIFLKAGDSGSLMVTNDANANPVGLLFAGNGGSVAIANPIDLVLSAFAVSVDGK